MRARDSVLQHESGKGFPRPLVCLHHGDLLGFRLLPIGRWRNYLLERYG
jgi:hypothetical protein